MNIRERAAALVGGPAVKQVIESYPVTQARAQAYEYVFRELPYLFTRERLLSEMDEGTYQLLQSMQGWEVVGSLTGQSEQSDERVRKLEVVRSRHYYKYDGLAKRQINIWTDFGYGDRLVLSPVDTQGKADWEEFVAEPKNRCLFGDIQGQIQSDRLLVDGELFLALFISTQDGGIIVRVVKTDEIAEVLSDPDDLENNKWYRRSFRIGDRQITRYYPDWANEGDRKRAEILPDDAEVAEARLTKIVMVHVKLPGLENRGWPLLTASLDWCKGLSDFMKSRLAVAAAVQTYVDKVTVAGGSRALNAVKDLVASSLQTGGVVETNPAPGPGSAWIQNKNVDRERLSQSTGGSDAQMDSILFTSMAGLASGTPLIWLNRPDAMQNRAVAQESIIPTSKQWNRYSALWAQVYRDLYTCIRKAKEEYASHKYSDTTSTVGRDIPIGIDLDVFTEVITKLVAANLMPTYTAALIMLNRPEFGLEDPEAVIEKMFPKGMDSIRSDEEEQEGEPVEELQDVEAIALLEAEVRRLSKELYEDA